MERKRIRSPLEDFDRRISLRNKKRVKYIADEAEEDQVDNEQPSTSTHNQRAQENMRIKTNKRVLAKPVLQGFWTVTCGNKKGILHLEKLFRGEVCIKSEDGWFKPSAFEKFGGKASSKKWKQTISHENKPLQFWIERGCLTKSFKGRVTGTTKSQQRKILSPRRVSESTSEESEIETTDDDVEDEDWVPGTNVEEEEAERVGTENRGEVVDSGDEKSKGKEDEDNDKDVFEERETLISTAKESAIKKVKLVIEKLSKAQIEEGREHSGASVDDPIDPAQTSDPPIVGGIKVVVGEEFKESEGRREDGQRELQTKTPLSAPATSAPKIKPKILDKSEHIGSTSNRTANLAPSPVPLVTQGSVNTRYVTSNTGGGPHTPPQSVLAVCKYENTDAAQVTELGTKVPRASDGTPISTSTSNPDAMDLNQLKREKIKMQLKVLKLQDEYYTLKIKALKE